jgi:hypothetical protein
VTFAVEDIVLIVQAIGNLDPEYLWTWSPVNPLDGAPDIAALAAMLDPAIDIVGETGYLLAIDTVPVLAVIGHTVHGWGRSVLLPDDPWSAVGTMLFLIDAAKHSIV